jgi:hypothetical protein
MSTERETLQVSVLPYRCSICPPLVNPDKSFSHTLHSLGRPVRFAAHMQPLCWHSMYHSRIVLSVGVSVWYIVRNYRYTFTIDSVLAIFKDTERFLITFPRHVSSRLSSSGETSKYATVPITILHLLICFFLLCLYWWFGPKMNEVTGEWRRLHNKKLHPLYSSPNVIRVIKSRRLRWAGHVARMGERRGAYRALVGNLHC